MLNLDLNPMLKFGGLSGTLDNTPTWIVNTPQEPAASAEDR
jgi:hypothetical protein